MKKKYAKNLHLIYPKFYKKYKDYILEFFDEQKRFIEQEKKIKNIKNNKLF